MGLEELAKFAPDQTLKINRLVESAAHFSKPWAGFPVWAAFRDSLWGKGVEFLLEREKPGTRREGAAGTSNEPLSDPTPAARPVIRVPETAPHILARGNSHIFVRSEYETTELAALVANTANLEVFLILGQSGIGKTIFLTWLLMRRLALRLPTVLQVNEHRAILFHEGGTSQFLDPEDTEAYTGLKFNEPSSRIWVLVDSNQVSEPAPTFRTGRAFFVIQATSRYQDSRWARRVCFEYFYMKTWSLSEVLRARPFFHSCPPKESQIQYLYNTYRASPRELVHFAHRPGEYKALVTQQVQQIKPGTLPFAFQSPDLEETYDLITRMEPSPTSRSVHEKTIASRGVFELLWERYLQNRIADMKRCYDAFKDNPVTAPAAGWTFEFRMHQLLRRGYPLKLFPLGLGKEEKKFDIYDNGRTSHKRGSSKNLQLAVSQEHHPTKGDRLQISHYYRPVSPSFPTIDSLVLVHPFGKLSPILLTFQMTRDEEHRVNEEGLRRIRELVFPPGTRRYHVVVTPRGMEPRVRVPKGCECVASPC